MVSAVSVHLSGPPGSWVPGLSNPRPIADASTRQMVGVEQRTGDAAVDIQITGCNPFGPQGISSGSGMNTRGEPIRHRIDILDGFFEGLG